MGFLFFYAAIVSACLLWSAAFTAAAAHARSVWLRRALVGVAVAVPVLALLPWVLATGWLTFGGNFQPNCFAPTFTAAIVASVGGVWIARTGLSPGAAPTAAEWPLIPLAAMFVLAKLAAACTLMFIDAAVRLEARATRAEAAAVMQSIMPPVVTADDDAAPLYRQAFALVEADTTLMEKDSPLANLAEADVSSEAVTDLLKRHALTIDLLRRGAAKPGCRFIRDWSRPSLDMLLPEISPLRTGAKLVALAARREAARGDVKAALADVVSLRRMAIHMHAEPMLITGLVASAIDTMALETLMAILPRATDADAAALDATDIRDYVRAQPSLYRQALGEEAFGLATFAALADRGGGVSMTDVIATSVTDGPLASVNSEPLAILYRCFFLPDDLAAYRAFMKQFQRLTELAAMPGESQAEVRRRAEALEAGLAKPRRGIVTGMIAPGLSGILESQARLQALRRSAEVLLDATRSRLATGGERSSDDAGLRIGGSP